MAFFFFGRILQWYLAREERSLLVEIEKGKLCVYVRTGHVPMLRNEGKWEIFFFNELMKENIYCFLTE